MFKRKQQQTTEKDEDIEVLLPEQDEPNPEPEKTKKEQKGMFSKDDPIGTRKTKVVNARNGRRKLTFEKVKDSGARSVKIVKNEKA